MELKSFEKYMALPHCSEDTELLVLGLAGGTLSGEDEVEQAIEHIAACDSCRYLLESYYFSTMHYEAEKRGREGDRVPWTEFPVFLAGDTIAAADPSQCLQARGPAVLDGGHAREVLFEIPSDTGGGVLTVYPSAKGVSLSIEGPDSAARYYLFTGDAFEAAVPKDGVVRFRDISSPYVLISRDMKRFIKITVGQR